MEKGNSKYLLNAYRVLGNILGQKYNMGKTDSTCAFVELSLVGETDINK